MENNHQEKKVNIDYEKFDKAIEKIVNAYTKDHKKRKNLLNFLIKTNNIEMIAYLAKEYKII